MKSKKVEIDAWRVNKPSNWWRAVASPSLYDAENVAECEARTRKASLAGVRAAAEAMGYEVEPC